MADNTSQDNTPQGNVKLEYNVAASGLNLDNTVNQVTKGQLTYALNASVENFDSSSVNYQNEPGNEFCIQFPLQFILIGTHFIVEQNKHIFFITNPETGECQIGYMENNDCVYRILVDASCLAFNINYPIKKTVHKITNCTTEIYWTDGLNPRRYLDINNIPYVLQPTSTLCDPAFTDQVDCNQLKIQPNFSIPELSITDVRNGGSLIAGTYQFAIQYADASGNGYTSYYSVTNPTPIADIRITNSNFNYEVGKSIVININALDSTGQFQYFNLAVIKTINSIPSVELVGTYFIDQTNKDIIYTGQNQTQIRLTIFDIFEKFPYYDVAQDLTSVQDILIWDNLTSIDRINYQSIASQIDLKWQTYKIPANENYSDELNATNLRGYLRDEVYAFEIVFLLRNGKQTDGFHIPGRVKGPNEALPDVPNTNPDFIGEGTSAPYWKIYNTASVIGAANDVNIGNATPYQYGEFAYWESEDVYPCNLDIWGDLADQPIRHHKFPDVLVSPIIESAIFTGISNMVMQNDSVFPIGVKVDSAEVFNAINSSNLTSQQKFDIVGFKIVRGDRGTNKSIIAKGILRNVGKYKREGQSYYFPNYPYNDVDEDPFLNEVNNAWKEECITWNLIITKLAIDPDGGPDYAEVEYLSCDTNKLIRVKYYTIGQQYICGMSRPVFYAGEGKAGYADYDVWKLSYGGGACNGFRATWEDIFEGTKERWIDGFDEFGVPGDTYVQVIVGTIPKCIQKCRGGGGLLGNTIGWVLGGGGGGCDPDINGPLEKFRVDINCKNDVTQNSNANISSQYRHVFNSPETSFGQPFLGKILKLENVMYGAGKAHFAEVKNNAKYRLLTEEAQRDALKSSSDIASMVGGFNATAMFTAYQSYLTIYVNGITRKNYAYSFNSIASYDYWKSINNGLGIKQRNIDLTQYLIPGVQSVGDDFNINNYQRESSVYIKTVDNVQDVSITYYEYTICNNNPNISTPTLVTPPFKVNYTDYLTGVTVTITIVEQTCQTVKSTTYPVRIAGDLNFTITLNNTFTSILNTKFPSLPLPDFSNNMVASGVSFITDTSRVTISQVGNCSNPMQDQPIQVVSYYASMKNDFVNQWGQMYSYDTVDTGFQRFFDVNNTNKTSTVFGGDTFISRFAFKTKLPFFIDNRVNAPNDSDIFYDEIGNIAYPKYWHSARSILRDYDDGNVKPSLLTNIITYKAHNFDCPNSQLPGPPDKNPNRTYYDGYFYLFAYGIPNFYCESSYNTDLRQAYNNKEGDFWPHVSTSIPDDWVQEDYVSIANDNTYFYNVTFSKQNKENTFTHLPPDWTTQLCYTHFPFRAIYSDTQNQNADVRVNNWLIYRPISLFDFPQNFGKLTSLDGIQNKGILARFENKSLLYNTMLTINTSNPQAAYIGNPTLFTSSPPIDFAETDLGYVGSQNKMLLKIPQGQITVDAKRVQVFLISGNQAVDLSGFGSGMNRFFTDHLAFEILRYFPDKEVIVNNERIVIPGVDVDNNFTGVGLHGVYDSKFDRIILTKLDYIPIDPDVKYDSATREFYVEEIINGVSFKTQVYLTDPEYFCNKSWTLSFNFNTKSWISFHSYIPNWYIAENNFFYSGINGCCSDIEGSFDALVELVGKLPPTTTTTSSSSTSTSTTMAPRLGKPCNLEGIIFQTSCELLGDAIITVPPSTTTTVCARPSDLFTFQFYAGYTIDPNPPVISSGTLNDACNAIITISGEPFNVTINRLPIQASSLDLGQIVYDGQSNDCTLVPDGWYFTNESSFFGNVYHVESGVISEIGSCLCDNTTTTTTTLIPSIKECCGILLNTTNSIYYYSDLPVVKLNIPSFTSTYGIAMTSNYLWSVTTEFLMWDITLSPFNATFNTAIPFPGAFTTSSGIVAIDDSTLIAVDDSASPQDIVELVLDCNVTPPAFTSTVQFSLQVDRTAIGNMLYTTGGKLLVINIDTISGDTYITQYDYATGVIELDLNIGSIAAVTIHECECDIFVIDTNNDIYIVNDTSITFSGSTDAEGTPFISATQLRSCVPTPLIEPTTTSTSSSTTTTTTTTP